ncbi:MAG: hypothetical protein ABGX51_05870, partial [Gammaproteobacteria bacterium]
IKHNGSINANSISVDKNGKVQLFAKADINIATDAVITTNGVSGGDIKIESESGTVWNSGTIEAIGDEGKGGHVEVLGERVALLDNASIDASGETGGGEVLVGGDYQGKNEEVKNATHTYAAENTVIKADAITNGDGGKVILWADETARVYGEISARGGSESGDGGFVETSGKKYLDVTKAADVSASNGEGGTWLLDPEDVTISSAVNSNVTGASPFTPAAAGSSNLNVTILETALNAGGTVVVDTTGGGAGVGDLTVTDAVTMSAAVTSTLELRAHNDININADITSSGPGILNMNFNADQDSTGGGAINLGVLPGPSITLGSNVGTLTFPGETINVFVTTIIDSASIVGSVDLQLGTLTLTGGGTHTADFSLGAFTALDFSGGTHIISTGSVTGTGAVAFTGGTTTFAAGATYNIDTDIVGGDVNFNNAAVTNIFSLLGSGTLGGTGSLLTTTSLDKFSPGTITVDFPFELVLGAGSVSIVTTGTIDGTGEITNQGSLTLDGGTINTTFTNTGTVSVISSSTLGTTNQTAGNLIVVGGATTLTTTGLSINGGSLLGDGTISGSVTNNGGILSAGSSPGTLTITGSYTQGAGGTLQAELAGTTLAGTDYDLLSVSGTASLGGTLDISLFGGFIGSVGDTFDIINASSITGDFSNVTVPTSYTFTNTPDFPAAGNYQINLNSIGIIEELETKTTTSVIVTVDTEKILGQGGSDGREGDGKEGDDEEQELACQ